MTRGWDRTGLWLRDPEANPALWMRERTPQCGDPAWCPPRLKNGTTEGPENLMGLTEGQLVQGHADFRRPSRFPDWLAEAF